MVKKLHIPQLTNKKWRDLVTGEIDCNFEFLAVKLLLFRLRLNVKNNPNEDVIKKSTEELHNFFVKKQRIPLTQRDLKKIFGGV